MSVARYAKAIAASVGGGLAWITQNVQITDSAVVIPLTGEAAGTAAAVFGLVYAVYRIPNKPEAGTP